MAEKRVRSGLAGLVTGGRIAAVASIAAVAAGCSSSQSTLSSLLPSVPGSTASVSVPAPKPITPTDRAVYVARISAKAQKCGYNFDAAKLKTNFLAAETGHGTPAEELAKIDQAYDQINRRTVASIADAADYCNEKSTESIKRDLTSALAGQFDPPRAVDPDAVLAGYTKKPDQKFDYETAIGGSEVRERKRESGSGSSED